MSMKQETSDLMKQTTFTISADELRIRVRNQARPMAGIMEEAADAILASTDDPELKYEALRWKTEAIPALFNALFRPDPTAALIDASAFVEQMRLFFKSGVALRLDDAQVALVINSADQLKNRLQGVYLKAGATQDEIDTFWHRVEEWAQNHPIGSSFIVRDSTTSLLAHYVSIAGGGIGAAVGNLQEGMADMADRIDLMAEFLPRQARWQAEMLVEQMMTDRLIERAMDHVGTVPIELGSLPFDIAVERQALLDAMRKDGVLIGDWISDERMQTFAFLSSEMDVLSELVVGERGAVLEALIRERELVVDALRQERRAAFEDLATVIESALERSRQDVVDHFMLRVAQLLAVVLPAIFLGCLFLVWYTKRPQRD